MTFPASGSDPFDYSEDSVAARVTVEVPPDAAGNLDAIVRSTAELRTNLEASARANASVVDYLNEMPALLQTATESASRYQNALIISAGGSRNAPLGGRNDPTPAGAGNAGPDRGEVRSASDVNDDLNDLEERDPRQAANMRAQRAAARGGAGARPGAPARPGSGRPPRRPDSAPSTQDDQDPENQGGTPSPDHRPSGGGARPTPSNDDLIQRGQQYANRGQDFVNQVLNETRQGQSGLGNSNATIRGLRAGSSAITRQLDAAALRQHIAEGGTEESFRGAAQGGGRLGTAARAAGSVAKVAGAAGIAYTAVAATQSVGEQYQTYKNAGLIRGGGAAEGLGYEGQIRAMAMNPFINTEQSRKIINTALSEGYTGKEMDTVTDFMADNLKNMNLSVADSVKLLNTNVTQGGQSLQQLNTQLGTMKDLAGGGYATLQDRQEIYSKVSNQAVMNGASGEQSGDLGNLAGDLFSGDKQLAGVGANIANAMQNNPLAQQGVIEEFGLQGLAPSAVMGAALEAANGDAGAVLGAGVSGIQERFRSQFGPLYANAKTDIERRRIDGQAQLFWVRVGYAEQGDMPKAKALSQAALDGRLADEVGASSGRLTESEQKITENKQGGISAALFGEGPSGLDLTKDAGSALGTVGAFLNDIPGAIFGDSGFEDTKNSARAGEADHDNRNARYKNTRVQDLVKEYGTGSIEVEGGDGVGGGLDQNNQKQIEAIVKGDAKLKINGSEAMTIGEAEAMTRADNAGAGTAVTIDLTDAAKKLVTATQSGGRNDTQMNADAGIAGARNSNQTPSETAPR